MNTARRVVEKIGRCWLAAIVLLIFGSGFAGVATADALGDFISAYKKIEYYAPAGSLPVKSADLDASKALFDCLADAEVGDEQSDPGVCINKFHDTPLGKQASDTGGIPETFWRAVDAYIAYLEDDYWGVAYHLGEAAVCAVVQVLLGGVDACSLIKELVELAEDIYDAAKWTVEFLADVGGAAAEVGTCIVTVGIDCGDDSPPPPPESYVYEYVFLPRIAEGISKREAADGSYEKYVQGLVDNAAHKPYPVLSKPWPSGEEGPWGAKQMLYPNFASAAIAKAKALYEKAVDTEWSKHVLNTVYPQLGMERMDYLQSQTSVVAKEAAQAYLNKHYASADVAVKSICYDHFTKDRPYRHVDQWIAFHPNEVEKYKTANKADVLVSNPDWCEKTFWAQKSEFAKHFREYVVGSKLCPEFGGGLVCQSLSGYKACAGLMGSVGQQAQCGMNVQYVGTGIAQEIIAYFKSKGSIYAQSCVIPKVLSSPQSKSPAILRCPRPTLQYHCDKYYQQHYGTGPNALPVKALSCELGAKQPAEYQDREDKTWGSMVPALVAKRPEIQPYVSTKGYDPLRILLPPKVYGAVAADASALDFQLKTGMDTQPSLDGEEQPTLASSLESVVKDTKSTMPAGTFSELNAGGVNPPDPTGKLTASGPGSVAVTGSALPQSGVIQQELPQSQVMSGELPSEGSEADTMDVALRGDAADAAGTHGAVVAGSSESSDTVALGSAETGSADTGTTASGGRARGSPETSAEARPAACEFELSYLAPQAPVLESTSPSLAAGDQVRITCRYAVATRRVALPSCDEQARRTADTFRTPGAAMSRVLSGIVAVDGQFIGVGSIPAGSRSYEKTAIWSFAAAGSYTVSCQVDNPLGSQVRGADSYVAEAISVQVGAVSTTGAPVGFDPAQARPLPTRAVAPPAVLLPDGRAATGAAPGGREPVVEATTGTPSVRGSTASDRAGTDAGPASARDADQEAMPATPAARSGSAPISTRQAPEEEEMPVPDSGRGGAGSNALPAVQVPSTPQIAPPRSETGPASTRLPAVQQPAEAEAAPAPPERGASNALPAVQDPPAPQAAPRTAPSAPVQ